MKQSESDGLKEINNEASVVLTSVKAKWNQKMVEYTLNDVNLDVKPGSLVAVIGEVGAGKSSLIQAILGELPIESGNIDVKGDISYASQEPWLFSGTIRQNILFGQPMDKARYKKVIKKCALERDFQLFANGDKTIVGERGMSLSGGQKARISLARAVYRNASVYLLDDPLSAVDAHVGKHLFDQCIKDFLRGNVVILVTHQLQFLQHADRIVILEDGKIQAVDTYDNLIDSGLDFAKLLAVPTKEDNEHKDEFEQLSRQNSERSERRDSVSSVASSLVNEIEGKGPEQNEEKRVIGKIGFGVYKQYFNAGGGFCMAFGSMVLFIASQILASGKIEIFIVFKTLFQPFLYPFH
jgi:ATP-binding cassette subfamily C (CFTR/MRP) protein 4